MDRLSGVSSLEFEQVFELEGSVPPTRAMLVTTFLAILELVRLAAIRVYQGTGDDGVPTGPIHLRASDEGMATWSERVADVM
jgi:chromatin segregation and condensation protein Rec8/ScpA/Scc1 (kleisin family)